jgi:hypothetical protein
VPSIGAVYMGPLMCSVHGAPDVQTYRPTDIQTYRPTVHGAPDVQSICTVYMGSLMYRPIDLKTCRPTDLQTYIPTNLQTYIPTDLQYIGPLMCSLYMQCTWGP